MVAAVGPAFYGSVTSSLPVVDDFNRSGIDIVLGSFLHFHAREELDGLLRALGRSALHLGKEVDTCAADVVLHGEVGRSVGWSGAQSDAEDAEAIELDAVRVLQLVLHHLDQFADDGYDVGTFYRAISLNATCPKTLNSCVCFGTDDKVLP